MIDKIEHKGDIVYLKRDWFGWRVVEPIIEPETKKFIWKNFLNKKGFLTLGFIILVLSISSLAFQEELENYSIVMNNPCQFCEDCQEYARGLIVGMNIKEVEKLNFSQILNGT